MKKAYMTIDDGPSVDRKMKVDILNRYHIQAVWFCMGQDILERPENALYTLKSGHVIGNHSFSHPNFSKIPLEQCEEEIRRTDEIIDDIYRKAGIQRPVKLFRFPYGNEGADNGFYNFDYTPTEKARVDAIQEILKKSGYVTYDFEGITYRYFDAWKKSGHKDWLWTYDAMEWCIFQEKPPYGVKTVDDVLEMMELDLPERWMGLNYQQSDEIVVIHDHPQTSEIFETVVRGLLEKGLEFVKIV